MKLRITTDCNVRFNFPNYIIDESGINVGRFSDLADDQLEEYIKEWAAGFRDHIAKQREAQTAVPRTQGER